MIRVERSALSSYASSLLAVGRGVFSADEAQKEIGISQGAGGPQSTPPAGISMSAANVGSVSTGIGA